MNQYCYRFKRSTLPLFFLLLVASPQVWSEELPPPNRPNHEISTIASSNQTQAKTVTTDAKINPSPNSHELEIFISPEKTENLTYEIRFDLGGHVFPSVILSLLEVSKNGKKAGNNPYRIGDVNLAFSVLAKGEKPNTNIKVKVKSNRFIKGQTERNFVLPDPNVVYDISPIVDWDFEKLRQLDQPISETFTIEIISDSGQSVSKVFQPRIRSATETVLGVIDERGKLQDLSPMFAAYVNEDHPIVDQILDEARTAILPLQKPNLIFKEPELFQFKNFGWAGYQSGPISLIQQVTALWYLFQKKNFVYSSITESSSKTDRVWTQNVRPINEAYGSRQANCVDGSVLFASILRRIGIDPVLVLKPGHMYLMFYAQPGQKEPLFLETTLLGNYHPKGLNPKADFKKSFASFYEASNAAAKTFRNDSQHYIKESKDYNPYKLIDIKAFREVGITPIGR